MSDAPDELESAMILGDPGETVSLETIKAMARAVRDAGWVQQAEGAWVSHNVGYDGGHDVVFGSEVEALRYALSYFQTVTFVPFGKAANEVTK